ncbi:MAG: polymerase sigma factor [Chthonomonadaceae bacterium]|nr:polymerase sigma factor [Chthonomonadaceae bacterium]
MVTTPTSLDRLVRLEIDSPTEAKSFSISPRKATSRVKVTGLEADLSERDNLYAEFAPLVRRLVRQYGRDADMREDLAGEIYCRFCALLVAFDPARGVPLRPYLVRQLSYATYTYARQQWRIKRREMPWEAEGIRAEQTAAFDPTVDWLAALTQDQAAALLPRAMDRLPARQRTVVILRYFEERTFEEIATVMAIRQTTARSLLRHGLNSLRKAIALAELC